MAYSDIAVIRVGWNEGLYSDSYGKGIYLFLGDYDE